VIRSVLTQLMLPPALNFALLLLGLLLLLRYRRLGQSIIVFALATLWLLSLPWVKYQMYLALENHPPLEQSLLQTLDGDRTAIVVLGGGMRGFAPEYGHEGLMDGSIRRVIYAAEVASHRTLPILVSGGGYDDTSDTEAALMGQILTRMQLAPRWLEDRSRNTWENAGFSAPMLRHDGIDTVVLVTDAWHMRRAVACFQAQGLKVVPAPTDFRSGTYSDFRSLLPERLAIYQNGDAIREWLGILTYSLQYDNFRNALDTRPVTSETEADLPATAPAPIPAPSQSAPADPTESIPATNPSA